jgi:lambda family phage portal protein
VPGTTLDSVLIPAADVLHVFRPTRPSEQRGETWFSPVLYLLRLLREYLEADLQRQKTSALVSGFVTSPDGSAQPFPLTPQGQLALEPATITQLPVGTEVTFSSPADHGVAFDPFVRHMVRQIFSGMNLPYEVCGDLSSVTYASGRAGLLQWRRQCETIQYGTLIPLLCQPILNRWLELAAALGLVEGPVQMPRWACPTVEALDRSAEIQSTVLAIRAGLQTRREAVESAGWNIEDIDSELSADQTRARNLGLTLDVDPAMTHQGQEQPTGATAP